ncbi:MAG: hypothetical protein AB1648_07825 [Pseudomonadota bacterium]
MKEKRKTGSDMTPRTWPSGPGTVGLMLLGLVAAVQPTGTTQAGPETVQPNENGLPMFSIYYKGFVIQQAETGWIILNFPTWAPYGPTSPGPYSTEGIAKHQIDRLLESQAGRESQRLR